MLTATELAQLWTRHAAGLRLLARTRSDVADDCVQEAFLRLLKQSEVPDDPAAWLNRVVRNLAISRHRSDQRRRQREDISTRDRQDWFEADSASQPGAISPDAVQLALRTLEPDVSEIVIAHLWNGLSFRQIALAFDISASMAHRRYLEALSKLQRTLSELAR